jgi:hypothetical protein
MHTFRVRERSSSMLEAATTSATALLSLCRCVSPTTESRKFRGTSLRRGYHVSTVLTLVSGYSAVGEVGNTP